MYRDGIVDDDDWYDDEDGDPDAPEGSWLKVFQGLAYMYGFLAVMVCLSTAPGQAAMNFVLGEGHFLTSVIPGMWLTP